jgi:tetratricopeptide (TPR) repeat protein
MANLQKAPPPLGQYAAGAVQRVMAMEDPPTIVWSIVGTVAAEMGDFEQAATYFSRAVELNPDDGLTLNNAAWLKSRVSDDLEQALRLSDRALSMEPDNVIFRETRGQILLKLGRWREAISELEFAVNGFQSPNADTHSALAIAYDRCQNPELAERHRAIAERLIHHDAQSPAPK